MTRYLLPLGIFGVLVALLFVGLHLDPREVPSPLIDKPAPAFLLPQLHEPNKTLSRQDLLGKVYLLNVWASWCASCRDEQPVLMQFAQTRQVEMYGLNYKDQRDDALRWLEMFGNPYVASVSDTDGRVGIDWGVYGVPETFLIDRSGTIRYKHIGPVSQADLDTILLPKVRALQGAP
ncbi:MAG: DsbE family thiol:disulfide interchange protein [Gammaproteobacteria bacterium]|nr:DsbE family thiol:disulfide interchange protein [Gammaproteobacteria bacterium]MBI5706383.1 DsbE family thiol:disulfide interchange protein [Armatimonadota bacterium]